MFDYHLHTPCCRHASGVRVIFGRIESGQNNRLVTSQPKRPVNRMGIKSTTLKVGFRTGEEESTGYGIHWPDIDEDLSIDGLIGIKHSFPIPAKTM